jgi:hypothetical protein
MNATWKSNQMRTGMDKRQRKQNKYTQRSRGDDHEMLHISWLGIQHTTCNEFVTGELELFRLQLHCGERMDDSDFRYRTEKESRIQQEAAIRNASVDATCNIRLQEYWGSTKRGVCPRSKLATCEQCLKRTSSTCTSLWEEAVEYSMESTSCPVDLITTFRKQSHLIWTERTKYNDTSLRDACKQESRDTESIGRESTAIRDFGALITHTLKTMKIMIKRTCIRHSV